MTLAIGQRVRLRNPVPGWEPTVHVVTATDVHLNIAPEGMEPMMAGPLVGIRIEETGETVYVAEDAVEPTTRRLPADVHQPPLFAEVA